MGVLQPASIALVRARGGGCRLPTCNSRLSQGLHLGLQGYGWLERDTIPPTCKVVSSILDCPSILHTCEGPFKFTRRVNFVKICVSNNTRGDFGWINWHELRFRDWWWRECHTCACKFYFKYSDNFLRLGYRVSERGSNIQNKIDVQERAGVDGITFKQIKRPYMVTHRIVWSR